MELNEMVEAAELVVRILRRGQERGSVTAGERALLAEYLYDISQEIEVNNRPKTEPAVEPEPVIASEPEPEPDVILCEDEIKAAEAANPDRHCVLDPQSQNDSNSVIPVFTGITEEEELVITHRNRDGFRALYNDNQADCHSAQAESEDAEATSSEPPRLPDGSHPSKGGELDPTLNSEEEPEFTPEVERIINDLTPPRDINSSAQAGTSLTHLIGINDRFIITRDLFGGDTFAYNRTIITLDNFTDINDALLYLHKTYNWDPASDGCQLLVEKLMQKLS